MKDLRRLVGIVLILAGAAGFVLSVLAIRGVHGASTSVSAQTTDILDSTKEGVGFLKRGATKTQNLLAETKARAQGLDTTLGDIAKKVKESPSEKAFLDSLENSVVKDLLRAQSGLASLQSTLEGFHNTLVLFSSLQGLSKAESTKDQKDRDEIQELSRSLTEARENLDQISRFLNDVLTDREVTLKGLNDALVWVKQIQGRLAGAEHGVDVFRQRLTVTEDRIASSQKSIPVWIEKGSLYACLLLACFAVTQVGLLVQGLSLFRTCSNDAGPAKTAVLE